MTEGGDRCLNESTQILLTGPERRKKRGFCYSIKLLIRPYEELTDSKAVWQHRTLPQDLIESPPFENLKANVAWQ